MSDLKVRYTIHHQKHLVSFETFHELPQEYRHHLKEIFLSWEKNLKQSAATHFLTNEIGKERMKQINICIIEESLPI